MKKPFLFLLIVFFLISCDKNNNTSTDLTIVLDQEKVEQNIIGEWKGSISGNNGALEEVTATIENMVLGQKVAEGQYAFSIYKCDFEWTYEAFNNGRVKFRERTLHPEICIDNLTVIAYFEKDNFGSLHLYIETESVTFSGIITRI